MVVECVKRRLIFVSGRDDVFGRPRFLAFDPNFFRSGLNSIEEPWHLLGRFIRTSGAAPNSVGLSFKPFDSF
jgi:hypothetical protein